MTLTNPLQMLRDFPVEDAKSMLIDLKKDLTSASAESEDSDILDILVCVIDSLQKELATVKKIAQLPKEKQARVLADMSLILQFLEAQEFGDDEDFYDDEEEFEDDEDFEDEDFDEDEEEEDHR